MLLVIDVGNSNTVFGLFDRKRLKKTWRVKSKASAISGLKNKIPLVNRVIVSSVVPSLNRTVHLLSKYLSDHPPLKVSYKLKMPIRFNRLDKPQKIGADRIVNAVASFARWSTSLIVIDFGTATTFDVINQHGEFLGGSITPGIQTINEALAQKCSQLPLVSLTRPKRAIGRNTIEAIQSGVLLGYASLVEGMIKKLAKEIKSRPKIIATGGLAPLISKVTSSIDRVAPHLTLEGLQILFEWNQPLLGPVEKGTAR